jgi:quercetin dioxygenase-like cupin family protein
MTMTRKTLKLTAAVAFIGCAFGGFAAGLAWATPASPPPLFVSTPLAAGVLGPIDTSAETDAWELELKTTGLSDVYVTHIKVAPGAHGGWHSHPGPSIITVKAGTATFYDDCNDFVPLSYPAGTGFVEDAGCVHLLTNEGTVDLEVIVMQIVPRGAQRRIDEADPFN